MADTKRGRERKGVNKRRQQVAREVALALDAHESSEASVFDVPYPGEEELDD
jgi:hypothetical protein